MAQPQSGSNRYSKNVTVFLPSDVTFGCNGHQVFMPNTIELAQIKKHEKGQYVAGILFTENMTELDVEKELRSNFHILRYPNRRFFCASAVDNRTRLEFHGRPRIWDGEEIKKIVTGNSALYILIEGTSESTRSSEHSHQPTTGLSDQQPIPRPAATCVTPLKSSYLSVPNPITNQQKRATQKRKTTGKAIKQKSLSQQSTPSVLTCIFVEPTADNGEQRQPMLQLNMPPAAVATPNSTSVASPQMMNAVFLTTPIQHQDSRDNNTANWGSSTLNTLPFAVPWGMKHAFLLGTAGGPVQQNCQNITSQPGQSVQPLSKQQHCLPTKDCRKPVQRGQLATEQQLGISVSFASLQDFSQNSLPTDQRDQILQPPTDPGAVLEADVRPLKSSDTLVSDPTGQQKMAPRKRKIDETVPQGSLSQHSCPPLKSGKEDILIQSALDSSKQLQPVRQLVFSQTTTSQISTGVASQQLQVVRGKLTTKCRSSSQQTLPPAVAQGMDNTSLSASITGLSQQVQFAPQQGYSATENSGVQAFTPLSQLLSNHAPIGAHGTSLPKGFKAAMKVRKGHSKCVKTGSNEPVQYQHLAQQQQDASIPVNIGSPVERSLQRYPTTEQRNECNLQPSIGSDIKTPAQIFNLSEEEFALAVEDVKDVMPEDIKGAGVVIQMCPTEGPVTGGTKFLMYLDSSLIPQVCQSLQAIFGGVTCRYVPLTKVAGMNGCGYSGISPSYPSPDVVPVTVGSTNDSWFAPDEIYFKYHPDYELELIKALQKITLERTEDTERRMPIKSSGTQTSDPSLVTGADSLDDVPVNRALLIGPSYASDLPSFCGPLEGVKNDLPRMSDMLRRNGFKSENIEVLEGQMASYENILSSIEELSSKAKMRSVVVIYFSGHGYNLYEECTFGLLPANLTNEMVDKFHLFDHCITSDQLKPYLFKLSQKGVLVNTIFDCCYSDGLYGGFTTYWATQDTKQLKDIFIPPHYPVGRSWTPSAWTWGWSPLQDDKVIHIAACGRNEEAYESQDPKSKQNFGTFTKALVEVIDELSPGTKISYNTLKCLIKRKYEEGGVGPFQTPQFEGGNLNLVLFGFETVRPPPGCFEMKEVKSQEGFFQKVSIGGGWLQGVVDGDYDVYDPKLTDDMVGTKEERGLWMGRICIRPNDVDVIKSYGTVLLNDNPSLSVGCKVRLYRRGSQYHPVCITAVVDDSELRQMSLALENQQMFSIEKKDTPDCIKLDIVEVEGKPCWKASQEGRMILPYQIIGDENLMAKNMSKYCRVKFPINPKHRDDKMLRNVSFKVFKVEKVPPFRNDPEKTSELKAQAVETADLFGGGPPCGIPTFQAHKVELAKTSYHRRKYKTVDGTGDAVVIQVINNENFPVHICVLAYQADGSIIVVYPPKNGVTAVLKPSESVVEIRRLLLDPDTVRRMVEPDFDVIRPDGCNDVLMLYATTEETDYNPLLQTAVELSPYLSTRGIYKPDDHESLLKTATVTGVNQPYGLQFSSVNESQGVLEPKQVPNAFMPSSLKWLKIKREIRVLYHQDQDPPF